LFPWNVSPDPGGFTVEKFKTITSFLLGIAILISIYVIGALIFEGTAYVVVVILPYLAIATGYVLPVFGIVLFPLTAFRRTRVFAVLAIVACTYLFGALLWCMGFVVTYSYWGFTGIFIGLVLAGVGVVPVALIAAAFHSEWYLVWNLLLGAALVFGGRAFALHKADQIDKEEQEIGGMSH
jgi:hypothetical protein